MQKVSIILAVVVVDNVAVAKFVITAVPSTWYVGSKVAYFGSRKEILYFMTQL